MKAKCYSNLWTEKKMSVEEAAYCAGFFDGEGCFMLMREKSRKGNRSGFRYQPIVEASSCDGSFLLQVRDKLGNGRITGEVARGVNHRPLFRLQLTPSQSRMILPQIITHLMLKRPQAELLLCYFEKVIPRGRQSQSQIQFLENLRAEIRLLNRRGRALPEDDQIPIRFREMIQPDPRFCSEDGCVSRHYAKGLCERHYKRQRYGEMRNAGLPARLSH